MKVILAGFNVDYELISSSGKDSATPETIAAAYARISRSPLSTYELREMARKDVEKARSSNERIVFEMGHSSIAEHAVFNIDVLGVSRLLVEEVEKFRLVSFTEKSQRYCLFQDDFIIPEDWQDPSVTDLYVATVRRQQKFYREAYEALKTYLSKAKAENLAPSVDNMAKEDARYIIPLATQTQLGMTINARNLELMIRRLLAHPLKEAKNLGNTLYKIVHPIAPSLIRYTEPTEYEQGYFSQPPETAAPTLREERAVKLTWFTPEADERLIAAILFRQQNQDFEHCVRRAIQLPKDEKVKIVKQALHAIQPYDQVRREFEMIELVYELTVSASCYAQLKRHRMATIIAQGYQPNLGVTIPPNLLAAGLGDRFLALIEDTNDAFLRLQREAPFAAPYILTNAHRRRVLLKVNARELYHIARLRADHHAQWDIRHLAQEMIAHAREVMPITLMLACGRDAFPELYHAIFSEEEN